MSDDTESIREPLARWLAERLPDVEDVRVGEFERPTGGFSAVTLLIPIQVRRGGIECAEQVVLRMETPEPAMYPAQAPGLDVEVDVQFRSMQAIQQVSSVPIAPLIGYEADASVVGAPFFVMGFVPGEIPRENPIYTQQGFFAEAAPEERRRLVEDGLRVLADIHRIDARAANFDWLVDEKASPAWRCSSICGSTLRGGNSATACIRASIAPSNGFATGYRGIRRSGFAGAMRARAT